MNTYIAFLTMKLVKISGIRSVMDIFAEGKRTREALRYTK